jgi:hypothetical protein
MSHFAKVVDGTVEQVITAEQDFVDGLDGTWVQTSFNTWGGLHYGYEEVSTVRVDKDLNQTTETILQPVADGGVALRKNFAGIGDTYDAERDAFYAPQPYASWTLNNDSCIWEAPTAYPDDGEIYIWDEDTTSWVEV